MKIGLLVGMEEGFPHALLDRIAERGGPEAGMIEVGAVPRDLEDGPDVLVDRISHEIAFYRGYLARAALAGARIVNDPVKAGFADRFHAAAMASRLGIAAPRSFLLPQKEYPPTVTSGSLRNLQYPLPWERLLESAGAPAVLRPASPLAGGHPVRVGSVAELLAAFDRTGQDPMVLEEAVDADRHVRAIVFGGERVILARYDAEYRTCAIDPAFLDAALEARVVRDAAALASALGLDIVAFTFALRKDVPVLADLATVPGFERTTLGPQLFENVVEAAADLCLRRATEAKRPVAGPGGPAARPAEPLVMHVESRTPATAAPVAAGAGAGNPPGVRPAESKRGRNRRRRKEASEGA